MENNCNLPDIIPENDMFESRFLLGYEDCRERLELAVSNLHMDRPNPQIDMSNVLQYYPLLVTAGATSVNSTFWLIGLIVEYQNVCYCSIACCYNRNDSYDDVDPPILYTLRSFSSLELMIKYFKRLCCHECGRFLTKSLSPSQHDLLSYPEDVGEFPVPRVEEFYNSDFLENLSHN